MQSLKTGIVIKSATIYPDSTAILTYFINNCVQGTAMVLYYTD